MARDKGHVLVIVGAQYGSEGKGVIANSLADRYYAHVRVGGPNAGHSLNYNGKVYKMQVVPCGWTNPAAQLFIGRGGLVDLERLQVELDTIKDATGEDIRHRLYVDAGAAVIGQRHKAIEGGTAGQMHRRIGSTGEGVGAARIDRIGRLPAKLKLFGECAKYVGLGKCVREDTPELLRKAVMAGLDVLVEGTQGSALSLIHGPWPFVTSHDTNAAQMLADCGLAPTLPLKVLLVARTYPIRVAGNSGPMKNEIDWATVSKLVGKPIEERTTVTKKVRRVAEWDDELLDRAITLNGPTSLALTFLDYRFPDMEGVSRVEDLSVDAVRYVVALGARFRVPVSMVGTGGDPWQVVRMKEL